MNSYSRRDFLKTIGGAGVLCGFPAIARAARILNPDTITISILHTTDLHGHILPTVDYAGNADLGGLARCVTQIRRWRRKNRNTILLDVGDIYQGTDVGLRSKGALMIDLFNHLRYDAWIIGNHEFDWGMEPFLRALQMSKMPVLAANTLLEGKAAGALTDKRHPLTRIQPYILKEIDGVRVAIIGVTTPGMPFWFRPEFIRDIAFEYPVEPVRRAISKAKKEGANAIVLAGHMGLKARTGGDDFANNVMSLTSEFPETAVFIGGHTHRNIPSRLTNGVLLTQSDHYGIHVGRVDLLFDRSSKRLLHRQTKCELMDKRIRPDHIVISRSKSQLAESDVALLEPIGELADTLSVSSTGSEPSELESLIGAAVMESLQDRGVRVDGAFHGVFDDRTDFAAGQKTINDIWSIMPYENYMVTAELKAEEMSAVMEETYANHERRALVGFNVTTEGTGSSRRVRSIAFANGRPLGRSDKYVIAFNTFDSRSAGHRFMKLRSLLDNAAASCRLHDVQTRDALIDYFRRHKIVRKITAQPLPAAA
jgi:2',3'-cyclic-nucleotide 2'-phosphodiesterase (5'-nucleotidase family)